MSLGKLICRGCSQPGARKVSGLCRSCYEVIFAAPELREALAVMIDQALELGLFTAKRAKMKEENEKANERWEAKRLAAALNPPPPPSPEMVERRRRIRLERFMESIRPRIVSVS